MMKTLNLQLSMAGNTLSQACTMISKPKKANKNSINGFDLIDQDFNQTPLIISVHNEQIQNFGGTTEFQTIIKT